MTAAGAPSASLEAIDDLAELGVLLERMSQICDRIRANGGSITLRARGAAFEPGARVRVTPRGPEQSRATVVIGICGNCREQLQIKRP